MALEWVVLGYAAGAEAVMVLLLTIPGLDGLRKGLIAVTRNLLKPFMSVVPFCLFLLMDIYWKYETRPDCEGESCSPTEHLRHQKSIMKSQRNALLIGAALIFYWLLYSVTHLVVKIEQLKLRVERLKIKDGRGLEEQIRRGNWYQVIRRGGGGGGGGLLGVDFKLALGL
ncbi:BCR-ASSOCIATED PROTEIN BAP [Salix koriyanagi]|uniref:Endoplasmic reticulum transmembrane protein n=1 Tax=Salix koriyanagi TaxID=2511006 RepID=A0A9Q0WL76_9ROSI|nr:BCR-ASSOCIATED PROTEIN BAP [Salix koriyanagi]